MCTEETLVAMTQEAMEGMRGEEEEGPWRG
jgi:hypothetical protein